jgi:hypothetical protein
MLTQAAMGVFALILAVLTIGGVTQLWHVYVFAFLFGSAAAVDARYDRPLSRSSSVTSIFRMPSRSTPHPSMLVG